MRATRSEQFATIIFKRLLINPRREGQLSLSPKKENHEPSSLSLSLPFLFVVFALRFTNYYYYNYLWFTKGCREINWILKKHYLSNTSNNQKVVNKKSESPLIPSFLPNLQPYTFKREAPSVLTCSPESVC